MTDYQFERACDINYTMEHYEAALDMLKDPAHYSLMIVVEPEAAYSQGKIIDRPRKIVDNAAADFIRPMIEEAEERLIRDIEEKIKKLKKEIKEL